MPQPDTVAWESWAHTSNSYLAATTGSLYSSGIISQRAALRNSDRVLSQKEMLLGCSTHSVGGAGQSVVSDNIHGSRVHTRTPEGGDEISTSDKTTSSAGPKATNTGFLLGHPSLCSSWSASCTSLELEIGEGLPTRSRGTLLCKIFNIVVVERC